MRSRAEPWFRRVTLLRDTYLDAEYVRATVALADNGQGLLDVSWMEWDTTTWGPEDPVPIQRHTAVAHYLPGGEFGGPILDRTPLPVLGFARTTLDPTADAFWLISPGQGVLEVDVHHVTDIRLVPYPPAKKAGTATDLVLP